LKNKRSEVNAHTTLMYDSMLTKVESSLWYATIPDEIAYESVNPPRMSQNQPILE
jgi:hypothetical protein